MKCCRHGIKLLLFASSRYRTRGISVAFGFFGTQGALDFYGIVNTGGHVLDRA
jgi:hypothetical protein